MNKKNQTFPSVKKTKLKNDNPTLNSLREKIEDSSAEELFNEYSPFLGNKEETSAKDVFKKSINLLTNLTHIELQATDNAYTCVGEEYKHITKFKQMHKDWTLNESLVSFSYRSINAPEAQEIKAFCTDIPAFLHMFNRVDILKEKMSQIATSLSDIWNIKNDKPEKIGARVWDEKPILIDFRKQQFSKNTTELVLCGTSFNHTLIKQHAYENATCQPKDIYFQIRYQSAEGKVKAGMAILSYDEWMEVFSDPDFLNFYKEVWNFIPLTKEYSERIEQYHNPTFAVR